MDVDASKVLSEVAVYLLGLASAYVGKLRRDVDAMHKKLRSVADKLGVDYKDL